MTVIKDVARHEVSEQRIERALEDIRWRVHRHWHTMQYDCYSDEALPAMRDDLLDYVAACTRTDPQLETAASRIAIRTAAECALGFLDLGCYPNGDQEIHFPLIGESISSEDHDFEDAVEHPATAADWLNAFALSVISGVIWERDRVLGLLLREQAAAINNGLPHSKLVPTSDPAELAEMDTLTGYLTKGREGQARDWPSETLRMPEVDDRLDGALRLNTFGTLTPDQRLLRVLLENDQSAFEWALVRRLVQLRELASCDSAPRSQLPVKTIALAALAVQIHGWDLRVRSPYLPQALLNSRKSAPN